jgi:hypothetical protein
MLPPRKWELFDAGERFDAGKGKTDAKPLFLFKYVKSVGCTIRSDKKLLRFLESSPHRSRNYAIKGSLKASAK